MATNPFRPSFGVNPVVTAGRDSILRNIEFSLAEGIGSPYRFTLISGARGSGKTVFLNQIEKAAKNHGWEILRARAASTDHGDIVQSQLPKILNRVDPDATHRSIEQITIAGIGGGKIATTNRYSEGHTLYSLLNDAARMLTNRGVGVLLTLDELQSADPRALHQLTDAIQDVVRDGFNVALVCAGLPMEINKLLEHPGTTFLRRAIRVEFEDFDDETVSTTLQSTAASAGSEFDPSALQLATTFAHGYAYLIQLVGSISWTLAAGKTIHTSHVNEARPLIIERMGQQVIKPALHQVPTREMEFLLAMKEDDGPSVMSDIALRTKLGGSQPSTYRSRLIRRGLIQPAGHGRVDFAIPYLREYLRKYGDWWE